MIGMVLFSGSATSKVESQATIFTIIVTKPNLELCMADLRYAAAWMPGCPVSAGAASGSALCAEWCLN